MNNTAAPANAVLLELELPAGLEYLPGSVSGATESDISKLEKPVLALPDPDTIYFAQGTPEGLNVCRKCKMPLYRRAIRLPFTTFDYPGSTPFFVIYYNQK